MKFKKPIIPIIDVYITGNCNFRCPYCFGEDIKNSDISLELFNQILDFAKENGSSLGLTGGEPLLHKKFRKLIQLANQKNVPLILRTNGMLLDQYLDIVDQFEWIGISLDGLDDINDKLRPNAPNYTYTKKEKLEIPLANIQLIKTSYPKQKILLASLASSFNTNSLLNLAFKLSNEHIQIDKWKIYQFTRNNFRSISASKEYETQLEFLSKLEQDLRSFYKGTLIIKHGEGNCFIIDTLGNMRINNETIGSINDNNEKLVKKMLDNDIYLKVIENKDQTYNVL